MALPVKVTNGHSNGTRLAYLLLAVVAAVIIVLDTQWGRSIYPGIGLIHDRLDDMDIKSTLWPWLIGLASAWQLFWPRATWTVDQDGITRVIQGFFGKRRSHFPLSAIASLTVKWNTQGNTLWYWLHIKLASGQKIRFRIGRDEDEANALMRDLEEAGAAQSS